jgi:DNA-binding MurR/RpiR family transcriptional regulator
VTLGALRYAKAAGATCIALTSYSHTPLGKIADIELVTGARETAFRTDAVASRIAHLAVIDSLYAAVVMRTFDRSVAALDQANGVVEDHLVSERNGRAGQSMERLPPQSSSSVNEPG